jgi:hypothetical protein
MARSSLFDGDRIRKAHSVSRIDPVTLDLVRRLAEIPELRYLKVFPQRLAASNALSDDGKKNPVVRIGDPGIVGVELLIDPDARSVQFYALTSGEKGCGRRMVEAVVGATPPDWFLVVGLDWSGGFWQRMQQDYPRLMVA